MTSIAEFAVRPEEFVLAWAVKTVPSVRVEIERMVADGTETVTPYFWVAGESVAELESFERALEDDLTVEDVMQLDESGDGDERFYRATWRQNVRGILYALADEVASVLSAVYEGDAWHLKVLFADHDSMSAFHHYCATYNLSLELLRLYEPDNPEAFGKYEVTSEQSDALVSALESGYFEVPRTVTLAELAADLGISEQAASTRLRRGYANLVENTLVKRG